MGGQRERTEERIVKREREREREEREEWIFDVIFQRFSWIQLPERVEEDSGKERINRILASGCRRWCEGIRTCPRILRVEHDAPWLAGSV